MKHICKNLFIVILICLTTKASAETNDEHNVELFVHATSQKVIDLLESPQSDQQKSDGLTKIFVETMDVDWMGKFVIGKYWRELNDNDKKSYLEVYRRYLIASYIPLFKKYHKQTLNIKSIKALDNDQYAVSSEIKGTAEKAPYTVDYRIKYSNNAYIVRDIIAEGVSLLTTQRGDFGTILSNGGINALKAKLEEKARASS